jgi:hypothetical protein
MINRIHHPFQVLPSLDPSLLRQHHHDTSMRGNRQTSATPANVFPMEAFQSQVNVHLLSKQPASAGGKAVTPLRDSRGNGLAQNFFLSQHQGWKSKVWSNSIALCSFIEIPRHTGEFQNFQIPVDRSF